MIVVSRYREGLFGKVGCGFLNTPSYFKKSLGTEGTKTYRNRAASRKDFSNFFLRQMAAFQDTTLPWWLQCLGNLYFRKNAAHETFFPGLADHKEADAQCVLLSSSETPGSEGVTWHMWTFHGISGPPHATKSAKTPLFPKVPAEA